MPLACATMILIMPTTCEMDNSVPVQGKSIFAHLPKARFQAELPRMGSGGPWSNITAGIRQASGCNLRSVAC